MTIQELADAHVGHPEELDEDYVITAQRESFKWGALHALDEIESILDKYPLSGLLAKLEDKIKELKGEL